MCKSSQQRLLYGYPGNATIPEKLDTTIPETRLSRKMYKFLHTTIPEKLLYQKSTCIHIVDCIFHPLITWSQPLKTRTPLPLPGHADLKDCHVQIIFYRKIIFDRIYYFLSKNYFLSNLLYGSAFRKW